MSMAEGIAWGLYAIGVFAVATGSNDDPRFAGKPVLIPLALGIAWPLLALLVVVGRFVTIFRRD